MVNTRSGFEELRARLRIGPDGALTLNAQAMILLPRHFFRYILREVSAAASPEAFRKIFWTAGRDGAVTFCCRFQEVHGCTPYQAVEGYLDEMSLRGWGRFAILHLVPDTGEMEVALRNSALAPDGDLPSGNIIWEGAMCGAMAFLRETTGRPLEGSLVSRGEMVADGETTYFRIVVSLHSERKPTP